MLDPSLLWIVVFGIILTRACLFGSALIHLWLNPQNAWYKKMLLLDLKVWQRFYQFVLDVVLSLTLGAAIRLLIPGVASAPVGAIVGIALSVMIQAGGPYKNHVRRSYALDT